MNSIWDFLNLAIRQFAGGPGPAENNLVRFGLAAIFWLALLIVAWNRRRSQAGPREKLLVWGFGFALLRELIMLGLTVQRIVGGETGGDDNYLHAIEHGLEIVAVVVVAAAFLRYVLNDEKISRRYIQVGSISSALMLGVALITWPRAAALDPGLSFNQRWEAAAFHIIVSLMLIGAVFILNRERGWLPATVNIALFFLFLSESLFLLSFGGEKLFHDVLCPIANLFHILAIPVLGFVYLKEMSLEKKQVEEKLDQYRDHLKELVEERTAMLVAQNEIAASLSQSLDLKTVLDRALDKMLPVLSMDVGLIFLTDPICGELKLGAHQGDLSQLELELCTKDQCPHKQIAGRTIDRKEIISERLDPDPAQKLTNIHTLIGAPLISKEKIVGAITLGSERVETLDQINQELLAGICNQVGMAVENAYLYREAEAWADELSILHSASIKLGSTLDSEEISREIVLQLGKLTGREEVALLSWNRKQKSLTCLADMGMTPDLKNALLNDPDKGPLCDELVYARESIVIDRVMDDPRVSRRWAEKLGDASLLCTPVWRRGRQTILVFIVDTSGQMAWRLKDIELVESFVSRAAVALENAYLHKQLEWAAALEERQRIAANMHDGLAQTISLLGLKIDQATQTFHSGVNGDGVEALNDIRETVDRASLDVRKSISSLQNVPKPRKSLEDVLRTLMDEQMAQCKVKFDLDFSLPPTLVLSPAQVEQVIPIVQEAIINIRKHARATKIHLSGEQIDDEIIITVEDDGIGFDTSFLHGDNGSHFGLKIMRARAEHLGGNLEISSIPQQGSKIRLSWILDDEEMLSLLLEEPVHAQSIFLKGESYG